MVQRHPRILAIFTTGCVLLLVIGLVGWFGASAAGSASITLSPTSGLPASSVSVSGTGFKGKETVSLLFDTSQVGSVNTKGNGTFATQVTIPSTALPGAHIITATGQKSGTSAEATFQVTQNVTPTPTPTPTPLTPTPTPTPPPQTYDWPMYGFDAAHTGANPNETIITPANASTLALDWSAPLGNLAGPSSVAVSGGIVYSENNPFTAYDAITGATLWTAPVQAGGGSNSPVVVNGVVYTTSNDGMLRAFDATTGAALWAVTVDANVPNESPLVYANGILYAGWDDGYLYAFDASTGATLWSFYTGHNIYASLSVSNNVVYLAVSTLNQSTSITLYALHADVGGVMWQYTLSGVSASAPAIVGGTVYFATTYALVALDANTGWLTWEAGASVPSGGTFELAVAGGAIYTYSGGELYAYSITNGSLLWQSHTGDTLSWPCSSPVVADGVVYVGSNTGKLYAYNASTGTLLWSYTVTGPITSVPVVVNGMLYVSGGYGPPRLYAFRAG